MCLCGYVNCIVSQLFKELVDYFNSLLISERKVN